MKIDGNLLERIVGEVVRTLNERKPQAHLDFPVVKTELPAANKEPQKQEIINDRVITGELLDSYLKGHNPETLLISQRSVITPSGKDFIKKHNINITRKSQTVERSNWVILCHAPLPGSLGPEHTVKLGGNLNETIQEAVSRISRAENRGVIVIANQPYKGVCLANRHPQLFASIAASIENIKEVKLELTPELWFLNPKGKGVFQIRNLIQECMRGL